MAKRGKRRASRSRGGLGIGKLQSGIFRQHGLIQDALIGAGAATLADNTGISNMVPYGKYAAGGLVAGVGGVLGVFVRDMLKGSTGTSTGGSIFNY